MPIIIAQNDSGSVRFVLPYLVSQNGTYEMKNEKRKVLLIESLILGLAGALFTDLNNTRKGIVSSTPLWSVFLWYFLFGLFWFSIINRHEEKREQKQKEKK